MYESTSLKLSLLCKLLINSVRNSYVQFHRLCTCHGKPGKSWNFLSEGQQQQQQQQQHNLFMMKNKTTIRYIMKRKHEVNPITFPEIKN